MLSIDVLLPWYQRADLGEYSYRYIGKLHSRTFYSSPLKPEVKPQNKKPLLQCIAVLHLWTNYVELCFVESGEDTYSLKWNLRRALIVLIRSAASYLEILP